MNVNVMLLVPKTSTGKINYETEHTTILSLQRINIVNLKLVPYLHQ